MKINPLMYGVLVLVLFFGTILGFQAAGIWSISGKVSASGEQVQPSADDVNSIKGWMTLDQICGIYDVPLAELLNQFNLPADTPGSTPIKDLESDTFSVTALRDWLLSREQATENPQTDPAAPLPTQAPTPTAEVVTELTPEATEHTAPEKTITGKTTFQDLLDWGVPEETIVRIIGDDLPPPSTVIKDYVTGQGMEFSEVKTQLQVEVDKTK
jgi:hypothetical protein